MKLPATVAAFAVHVLTASGAALALIALLFAAGAHWDLMFFTLGLALAIDGIDGPLARMLKVKETLPRWSGDTLDLIVDFVTYVFVPAYAIAACGLMPPYVALAAGVVIVVTGALYFADGEMKTADNFFRGFPAVWNIAAFYLFLLTPTALVSALFVGALALLTFLPLKFLHPLRVRNWRALNVALLVIWAGLAVFAIWRQFEPPRTTVFILVAIAAYFFGAGLFVRTRRI